MPPEIEAGLTMAWIELLRIVGITLIFISVGSVLVVALCAVVGSAEAMSSRQRARRERRPYSPATPAEDEGGETETHAPPRAAPDYVFGYLIGKPSPSPAMKSELSPADGRLPHVSHKAKLI